MDYKEFVKSLRTEALFQRSRFGRDMITAEFESAATAIETLLAERDAAVEDLHKMHTLCTFCKGPEVSCWKDDPSNKNRCAAFEWRGPQKEDGDDSGSPT